MRQSPELIAIVQQITGRSYRFPTEAHRMTYLIKSLEAEILRAEPEEVS